MEVLSPAPAKRHETIHFRSNDGAVASSAVAEQEPLSLLYKGDYESIASLCLDREGHPLSAEQAPPLVSALTFLGRASEAEVIFERFLPELRLPSRVMCRFFLGVAKCRHFQFESARRYFAENGQAMRSAEFRSLTEAQDEIRFYVLQGFGFYRYTYGRLRAARRWAERSSLASVRASFLFGRLFAQELLAHVEINLGRTHVGLKLLEQSIHLAQSLGRGALLQMYKVTRAIYRSRYGISGAEVIEELLATLSETVFEDGYSRACLLAELSHGYLLKGNATKAAEALNSACEYVYRIDNPRLEILLNFRIALLLAQKGELQQALHLTRSALKRLESHVDRLLELRLAGFELDLLRRMRRAEGLGAREERVEALTRQTGYFVGRRILNRSGGIYFSDERKLQDPLGDLHDDLQKASGESIPTILRHGWLGLLYKACSIDVTQRTIVLGLEGKSVTLFNQGNVSHFSRGASNLTSKFLLCLSRGERTKQEIVEEVWGQSYHPLRHDPLLYSLVSKLRKDLGQSSAWVEATENGYELLQGVVVQELVPPSALHEASGEVVPSAGELSDLSFRQKQLLSLASKVPYVDVRSCVEAFKISAATANRDLVFLEGQGLLVRSGKGRATRYQLERKGVRA